MESDLETMTMLCSRCYRGGVRKAQREQSHKKSGKACLRPEEQRRSFHIDKQGQLFQLKGTGTRNCIACLGNDQLFTLVKDKFLGGMCKEAGA